MSSDGPLCRRMKRSHWRINGAECWGKCWGEAPRPTAFRAGDGAADPDIARGELTRAGRGELSALVAQSDGSAAAASRATGEVGARGLWWGDSRAGVACYGERVSASRGVHRMGWGAATLLVTALFALGLFGAVIVSLGCSENVFPGTARGDVCMAVGDSGGPRWWLLVCVPALVFGAVALLSGRRGPLGRLWLMVCAVLAAVDLILIAIVTDNL